MAVRHVAVKEDVAVLLCWSQPACLSCRSWLERGKGVLLRSSVL